jgi:N-acyl-D-aspartate/D-glutamate deacylase
MSDAVPPSSPRPNASSGPPNPGRRKLLLVAGFGATSALVLARLDRRGGTGPPAEQATVDLVVGSDRSGPTTPPALADAPRPPPPGHVFDTVIRGGRVMDPDSGFDQVADVGIDGGRITSISVGALAGRAVLDAGGMVVAPGFIDLLSYEPNPYGVWYKVADGVTTNLGMHGINDTAERFFDRFGSEAQRPPVHYGGAFDNPHMRDVVAGLDDETATAREIDRLERLLEEGFGDGWIGLDLEPEYTPWVTTEEMTELAAVAARFGMPVFSHIRHSSPGTPEEGSLAAVDELLTIADRTGAAVHVDHITSMATHVMGEALAKIDDARSRGLDVTACMYPYDFWATTLASQRFAPGWEERFRISYGDLEVAGTGERLTGSSFARYQAQNRLVAAHAIPEADVQAALRTPWVMIGSDAILEPGDNNHPRATGAFTRTLGRYVRDLGVLSLMDALAKMTILPARRLEARVPALRRKGRMQIGADADVTVFDPATVADRSTVADPAQMAVGVRHVVVLGEVVKDGDTLHEDVRPGEPVKAATA